VTGAEFGGVDIDLLADYIGGALDGTPDESVVAALITDDPAWRAAYESLGGAMAIVGAELSRLKPEPMPTALAAQLEAMFADSPEAMPADSPEAMPADSPEAMPADSPEATFARAPEATEREHTTLAVPHLALVRGDGASEDDENPVRKGKRSARRMKWAAPIAVAAGLIAFVGFGLDYLAGRDSAQSDSATSSTGLATPASAARAPGSEQTFHSGIDYTAETLAGRPVQPLTAPGLAPSSARKASPDRAAAENPAAALQRLTIGHALQDCLDAIEQENGDGPISVESLDYARFEGAPALIVRFTADNGEWGWASGPTCGTPGSGAATLGKVPVR
jgi:hypothetical protein